MTAVSVIPPLKTGPQPGLRVSALSLGLLRGRGLLGLLVNFPSKIEEMPMDA